MKKTLQIAGITLFTMLAAACNTVDGAGQDIEAGGEAVQDAANDVEEEISN